MDAVLSPSTRASPAPPAGGALLVRDTLQERSKAWVGLHQDHEGRTPPLCPDTWRRHLEPCARQEISEVNALSCLILLGLCSHSFPSSDMTQECRTDP